MLDWEKLPADPEMKARLAELKKVIIRVARRTPDSPENDRWFDLLAHYYSVLGAASVVVLDGEMFDTPRVTLFRAGENDFGKSIRVNDSDASFSKFLVRAQGVAKELKADSLVSIFAGNIRFGESLEVARSRPEIDGLIIQGFTRSGCEIVDCFERLSDGTYMSLYHWNKDNTDRANKVIALETFGKILEYS